MINSSFLGYDLLVRECCGEQLTSVIGRARRGNVSVELLRCRRCEQVHTYADIPHTWGRAICARIIELEREALAGAYWFS
jgi:hypothetical protein